MSNLETKRCFIFKRDFICIYINNVVKHIGNKCQNNITFNSLYLYLFTLIQITPYPVYPIYIIN